MSRHGRVLAEAQFDPKLKTYLVLQGLAGFVGSIVGIFAVPFWLVLGPRWAARYYERLTCTLTDRALIVRKGVWFRSESTVPLDRIQDVGIRHGPILDRFGLATIRVETAGMRGGHGSGINLTGVVDTAGFRDRVLEARDLAAGYGDEIVGEGGVGAVGTGPSTASGAGGTGKGGAGALPAGNRREAAQSVADGRAADAGSSTEVLLTEIRDSLGRIEELLQR